MFLNTRNQRKLIDHVLFLLVKVFFIFLIQTFFIQIAKLSKFTKIFFYFYGFFRD